MTGKYSLAAWVQALATLAAIGLGVAVMQTTGTADGRLAGATAEAARSAAPLLWCAEIVKLISAAALAYLAFTFGSSGARRGGIIRLAGLVAAGTLAASAIVGVLATAGSGPALGQAAGLLGLSSLGVSGVFVGLSALDRSIVGAMWLRLVGLAFSVCAIVAAVVMPPLGLAAGALGVIFWIGIGFSRR